MKLIVGLGNPGRIYANSRHNLGATVIRQLAKGCGIPLKREINVSSLVGKGKISSEEIILAAPLTYMNLSGQAVSSLIKKFKIDLKDMLITCDDLDLEFGRLRIKKSGSSGGHRGLKSIIEAVGSQDFCRLRVGIGRSQETEATEYVLSHFNKQENKQLEDIIERACRCCEVWVKRGITKSMNIFNKGA